MLEHGAYYQGGLQGGALALDTTGTYWRLHGTWSAPGCAPGQLILVRAREERPLITKLEPLPIVLPEQVEGREVKWVLEVEVPAESLVLLLYDNKRFDGDTVTLFVNGSCIARSIAVPHRDSPRAIRVNLVPGTNYLVMQAENEGSIPPNTAGLVLRSGDTEHRLVLRADAEESAGLKIIRGP